MAAIIEGNVPRVQGWLDEIEEKEGAGAALRAFTNLIEFAIPRRARNEFGSDDGPGKIILEWGGVQEPEHAKRTPAGGTTETGPKW